MAVRECPFHAGLARTKTTRFVDRRDFTVASLGKNGAVFGTEGLEDKLAETEAQVDGMREELTALQPKLVVATKETDAKIEDVKAATLVAEETKVNVQADEKVCAGQAEEANAMKAECEAELAEAIPALNAAIKAHATYGVVDVSRVTCHQHPAFPKRCCHPLVEASLSLVFRRKSASRHGDNLLLSG